MCRCSEFWVGMVAGVAVGATVAAMNPKRSKKMKTQVGQSIQKFSEAVDQVVDNMMQELQ